MSDIISELHSSGTATAAYSSMNIQQPFLVPWMGLTAGSPTAPGAAVTSLGVTQSICSPAVASTPCQVGAGNQAQQQAQLQKMIALPALSCLQPTSSGPAGAQTQGQGAATAAGQQSANQLAQQLNMAQQYVAAQQIVSLPAQIHSYPASIYQNTQAMSQAAAAGMPTVIPNVPAALAAAVAAANGTVTANPHAAAAAAAAAAAGNPYLGVSQYPHGSVPKILIPATKVSDL